MSTAHRSYAGRFGLAVAGFVTASVADTAAADCVRALFYTRHSGRFRLPWVVIRWRLGCSQLRGRSGAKYFHLGLVAFGSLFLVATICGHVLS